MSTVPFYYQHFHDLAGHLAAGGSMYVYAAGSPVPKAIYSDHQLSTPRANPMALDGNGVAPQWFVGTGLVDIKVYDANNALIFTALNVEAASTSGGTQYPTPTGPGYLYFDGTNYSWTAVASDHKAAITAVATPDYLQNLLIGSASVTVTPVGNQLQLSSPVVDDHKVAVDATDIPGYLTAKFTQGSGISIATIDFGTGRFLQVTDLGYVKPTEAGARGYLNTFFIDSPSVTWSKSDAGLTASVSPSFLDHKVQTLGGDPAGHLVDKVASGAGINVGVTYPTPGDAKLLISSTGLSAIAAGDTSLTHVSDAIKDSDSVSWSRTVTNGTTELRAEVVTPADGKVAVTSGDPPGYLNTKIKAGAGITLTSVVDAVDGMQLWIDSKANFWSPVKTVNVDTYNATDADATIVARYPGGICNVILPEANASRKGRSYRVVNQSIGIYAGESVEVKAYNGAVHGSGLTSLLAGEVGNYTCLPMTSGSNAIIYRWMAW